ncbi:hypothetical protein OfM1_12130 [Lactovum odontotermitis]
MFREQSRTDDRIEALEVNINERFNFLETKIQDLQNSNNANAGYLLAVNDSLNMILRHEHEKKVSEKIKVFYLVSNLASIDTVKDLILRMSQDERFEVFVGSIHSRMLPNPNFENESKIHEKLEELGIAHIRMPFDYSGLTLLKRINPDVIVRQTHWDADLQEHYSSKFLSFTRLAILDYALGILVNPKSMNAEFPIPTVDDQAQRLAWRVFHSYVPEIDELLAENSLPNLHNQVNVGSPKVDTILKAESKWFRETTNKKIYWFSHHSIGKDWLNFGLFPKIYKELLAFAQKNQDVDIVFCEHPSFRSRLMGSDLTIISEEYNNWLEEWNKLDNTFELSGDSNYIGYLKGADVIVTDGISSLTEGQIASKPIVFLERNDHMAFNSLGEKISNGWHSIKESDNFFQKMSNEVNDIMEHGDSLKENQEKNLKLWTDFGNPVKVIMDEIAKIGEEAN